MIPRFYEVLISGFSAANSSSGDHRRSEVSGDDFIEVVSSPPPVGGPLPKSRATNVGRPGGHGPPIAASVTPIMINHTAAQFSGRISAGSSQRMTRHKGGRQHVRVMQCRIPSKPFQSTT